MSQKIEEKVKSLKELDLKKYPYETIVDLINSVTVGLPILTVTIPKERRLVRSRLNGSINRFHKLEELSFIPQDKKSGFFARASTPNNTMFYATTSAPNGKSSIHDVETTFFEILESLNDIDAKCNAKITYGNWFPKEDLNLLAIIPYTQKYEVNDFIAEMKSYYNEKLTVTDPKYLTKASLEFIELMSSEFSKKVTINYEYMISAIFTEIVLKNNEFDGIFYPSIKNDKISYNVALIPETLKKLKLLLVVECSIYKNKENLKFCEDAIASINESGDFLWKELCGTIDHFGIR